MTCINPPPVRSAPKSNAAATTPSGRLPARSAKAIALKPNPALRSFDIWPTVPRTSNEPPSPARPPEMAMASMIEPPALMPAYRAAVRLKPAARSSKPFVVLKMNHDTTTAMMSAMMKP